MNEPKNDILRIEFPDAVCLGIEVFLNDKELSHENTKSLGQEFAIKCKVGDYIKTEPKDAFQMIVENHPSETVSIKKATLLVEFEVNK